MDLEEIGITAGNWVDLAEHRGYWRTLVNAALNLQSRCSRGPMLASKPKVRDINTAGVVFFIFTT